jgi:hypothetical protein
MSFAPLAACAARGRIIRAKTAATAVQVKVRAKNRAGEFPLTRLIRSEKTIAAEKKRKSFRRSVLAQ